MNILQIIQDAATRVRDPKISNAFSETNEQAQVYLSAANRAARSISNAHNWSQLLIDESFDTVIGQDEYDLPTDLKSIETLYIYNITNNLRVGTETSDRYLSYKASKSSSWTATRYRLIRDKIKFTVAPDQVNTMEYSYISKDFAKNIDGGTTYSNRFLNNEDKFLLDDELLILGIVIIVKQDYKFDTTLEEAQFNARIAELTQQDKGSYVISTFSPDKDPYIRPFRYPDDYTTTFGDY